MLEKAKERLQQKVANHPIGFELLPGKFTLATTAESLRSHLRKSTR